SWIGSASPSPPCRESSASTPIQALTSPSCRRNDWPLTAMDCDPHPLSSPCPCIDNLTCELLPLLRATWRAERSNSPPSPHNPCRRCSSPPWRECLCPNTPAASLPPKSSDTQEDDPTTPPTRLRHRPLRGEVLLVSFPACWVLFFVFSGCQ